MMVDECIGEFSYILLFITNFNATPFDAKREKQRKKFNFNWDIHQSNVFVSIMKS